MTDPVKVIQTVKHRLARIAATQTLTALLPPVVVLAAAAAVLRAGGADLRDRWGVAMASRTAGNLQVGLLCAAALVAAAASVLAMFAFRREDDSIAAAEQIDRKLGSRQEMLTVATLADSPPGSSRSPLFPILWQRAAQHALQVDPVRMFPLEIKPALQRAALLTVCTAVLVAAGISVLLAANRPPMALEGLQLRKIAREITSSNPADTHTRELAQRLRAVADIIDNPKVPPQTKLEQLASVQQELKKQQRQRQASASKGQSAGKGSGKGNQGQGSGESKNAAGQAKEGAGNGPGKGNGNGSGGGVTGQPGKGEVQLAQASKDISKMQARLEAEAKLKSGQRTQNGLKARAPRPGEQPSLAQLDKPGTLPNPNRSTQEHGQEQGNARREQPGQQRRDFGSSQGDTHLGQFPRPGNFERFYKAGEHGTPLDVRNARYVLFRIPPALVSAGGGKSVVDNDRPSATVPYANLPLKEERIAADPDEHQLVPPRYRDLLR